MCWVSDPLFKKKKTSYRNGNETLNEGIKSWVVSWLLGQHCLLTSRDKSRKKDNEIMNKL